MRSLSPLALLLLAACASGGSAPSLGHRAIENRSMDEPAQTPARAGLTADAALATRITALRADLAAAGEVFAELRPAAAQAVAGAGPAGSESWVTAQLRLTALTDAHGATPSILAEIDGLIAERLAEGREDGLAELTALQTEAARRADDQRAVLDSLTARLAR
ncbi:hypothetical protein GVO57_12095 [Sphingomonas changnyeongensis]|uniref:Uncharacterized protein n=1 Tax=Sphingomonas changnyeongensis TaxID=2698679 RepID=A0A7Z2NX80_9SPHN|nr:hypothetical protein [Sphingomonas changnyeongensis]QHL91417.1 hypothetical protein GVO57_12095 [Sphingomonas changnyeongensis]